MAAQASGYSEERNRLRLQAREQRNQETGHAKKHHAENVPLFGELYKTNKKEDALSNKIRMLLGSYEDGNSINPSMTEPLLIPFHENLSQPLSQSQSASTSSNVSSQSSSTAISDHYGNGSKLPKTELSQLPTQQQTITDLRGRSQAAAEPTSFLPANECENIGGNVIHHKDQMLLQHTQESTDNYSAVEVPVCPVNQSPKEGPLPRSGKSNPLLQQTFASLLSSKQPSSIMTQKPTAYVRPLDGQDQVINESPDLKPPAEPFEPLQDSAIDQVKSEMLLHYLETKTEGRICVEDILKKLIHPWPPLLTPIHTTFKEEPQSPTTAKEVQDVPVCPGQRISEGDPENPPVFNLQSSSIGTVACSKEESASSSESESCLRSESDSESVTVDPQAPAGCSTTEPDAPAVTRGNSQLGNWIRSSQQNSSSDNQGGTRVSDSLHDTQPASREIVVPSRGSQLSPLGEHHSGTKPSPKCSGGSHEATLEPHLADITVQTSHSFSSVPPGKPVCSIKLKAAVKSEKVPQVKEEPGLSDRPKVKTKTSRHKKSGHPEGKKTLKHQSLELNKRKIKTGEVTPHCLACGVRFPDTCSCFVKSEPVTSPSPGRVGKSEPTKEKASNAPHRNPSSRSHKDPKRSRHERHDGLSSSRPPISLVVKIDLSLLSRPLLASGGPEEKSLATKRTVAPAEQDGGDVRSHRHGSKKSSAETVDMNVKTNKRKLETKKHPTAVKKEVTLGQEPKKLKKSHTTLPAVKKESKPRKCPSEETKEAPDLGKKKSGTQERPHTEKKPSSSSKRKSGTCRPLLTFENRPHSVKHYIKEAKRLKHKADAEADKHRKGFHYLEAAMYFVESGIAMKNDPKISLSSHTMFAETVELLKFVLKLKSSSDLSPSEKDFIILCLKCQALLQMAMFQHKQKTALTYSKTLAEHFSTSAHPKPDPSGTFKGTSTPSPMPSMPSPASSTSSKQSGSGAGPPVTIPQTIGQMTFTYVNITALCLSAHDMWEQAEVLARKGSGLLTDLDSAMGPLTLTSSMSSMVRYTRQGIAWLRLKNKKVK